MSRVSRRDFTKLMAVGGASFLASPMLPELFESQKLLADVRRAGFGEHDKGAVTNWGRLRFRCTGGDDDDWNVHPHGDIKLISHINEDLSVNLSNTWNVADVGKLDDMCKLPLLFMHAECAPELQDEEKKNLKEYLERGGFLYAEDCVNGKFHHHQPDGTTDLLFRGMQDTLRDLLPGSTFERLDTEHPIYHSYFDLMTGQPHMQGIEHGGWGLTYKKRLVAYLSPSDAHCGWTNEQWFGVAKSREACKIGTNVYLYAMTH